MVGKFSKVTSWDIGSKLKDKVAIIAGGGGEIGFAMASAMADLGAHTYALDINVDRIEKASKDKLKGIKTDLLKIQEIKKAVDKIYDTHKKIDIVVHAAGLLFRKEMFDITEDNWDKALGVNLKSAFFLCQFAGNYMKKANSGSIILTSSISAQVGYKGLCDYVTSKGGLNALIRNLAIELAPYNIRVNGVAPGTTRTHMTKGLWGAGKEALDAHLATIPLGRVAEPEDQVGPVLFLATDMSAYVTGTVIPCDGGFLAVQADFIDLKLRQNF